MKNFEFSNNTEEYIYKEDVRGRGDHVWNKFLLSIDGWSATWGRIPWMLYSNCLLVKQKSTTV